MLRLVGKAETRNRLTPSSQIEVEYWERHPTGEGPLQKRKVTQPHTGFPQPRVLVPIIGLLTEPGHCWLTL